MSEYNGCIGIISSRTKCLKNCLESLYKHLNNRFQHPVYVFYFDDIYDSQEYRDDIHKNISEGVHFVQVPYESPKHIPEEEMFYNRQELAYVQRGEFTIKRKGYLHMCNFWTNFYGYPNTEFEKYDYLMVHDDESGYCKDVEVDPFETLTKAGQMMGAYITDQRLRKSRPHQGHLDTRVGMFDFVKKFLADQGIEPHCRLLKDVVESDDGEWRFHFLPWSDTYVLDLSFARSDLWQAWVKAINEDGGIYKYRWGDNEIFSLFGMIVNESPLFNLKLVDKGYHDQGKFRGGQSYAPSIKDVRR